MSQFNTHRIFSKENWKNKNWLRQLNRERIDLGRVLALRVIRFFFDRPPNSSKDRNSSRIPLSLKNPPEIKKVLILHFDDKIGDLVINTILFRELKKLGPHVLIDLVTGKNSFDLVDGHPALNQIFIFKKGLLRTLFFALKLRNENYDLVIDPRLGTDARTIFLLSQIQPKKIIGFHKQDYPIYTDSIQDNYKQAHMRQKVQAILRQLGLSKIDLGYYLISKSDVIQKVKILLEQNKLKRYLILNLYAGARFRSFLPETAKKLIYMIRDLDINHPIILIGPPWKNTELKSLANELALQNIFFFSELQKISEVSELVQHSQLVITPDTSLVHIASAHNIPVISVFRDDSDCEEKNSIQWAPISTFSRVILASDRTEGEVDVNTFSGQLMQKALNEIRILL